MPFYSIEWLKIRPRWLKRRGRLIAPMLVECGEALKTVLNRHPIPFLERDDSIWVFGYAQGSPQADWTIRKGGDAS